MSGILNINLVFFYPELQKFPDCMIDCTYDRQNHQAKGKCRKTQIKPMIDFVTRPNSNTHDGYHFKSQT